MIHVFPSRQVALEVFGFSVHWYGLMYLAGFLLGYALLPHLQKYRSVSLTKDQWSTVLTAVVLGVLVGGRLGYVFFYQPSLLATPLSILQVWNGGMASHGGFIGVGIALLYSAKKLNVPWYAIADIAIVPIAIGLAFGRLGNFINHELYGTVTALPWAMEIPGIDGLRHPLAIYGIMKNLLIAAICFWHLSHYRAPGTTAALMLMFYALLRFLLEFLRHQQYEAIDLFVITLTRGQVLTIPLFVVGAVAYAAFAKADSKNV